MYSELLKDYRSMDLDDIAYKYNCSLTEVINMIYYILVSRPNEIIESQNILKEIEQW